MAVPITSPQYVTEVNKSQGDVKICFKFREPLDSLLEYRLYLQEKYFVLPEQVAIEPSDNGPCITARLRKEDALKIQGVHEYNAEHGVEDLVEGISLVARFKTAHPPEQAVCRKSSVPDGAGIYSKKGDQIPHS